MTDGPRQLFWSSPRVGTIAELDGLTISLVLEPPDAVELFAEYADLVVVSDDPRSLALRRIVDPQAPSTAGFLRPEFLAGIRARYEGNSLNPGPLLHLPRDKRAMADSIELHCSLLPLGLIDRRYRSKFIFFVPSLASLQPELAEARANDYVEATMHITRQTHVRSIYLAGFGKGDGSFRNEDITRLVAWIYVARRALQLRPLRLSFKYFPAASRARLAWLGEKLMRLEASTESAVSSYEAA
jgi:hypothetical protein